MTAPEIARCSGIRRFIPLMISGVKIGDDLSAAALTRGLENPVRRTNITKVGFTGWDLLAVLIAGTALLSTYSVSYTHLINPGLYIILCN